MNNGDNPLDALSSIQAPLLFQKLPAALDNYAWVFIAAGFLLILGGHQWRIYEAGNDGHSITRAWYRTLLVLAFMVFSPKLCELGYAGVSELASGSGASSPTSVTRKCIRLALNTPVLESAFSQYSRNYQEKNQNAAPTVENAASQGGLWEYAKAYWTALGDEVAGLKLGPRRTFRALVDGPAMVASQTLCLVKACAIFFSSALTTLFLIFAGMLAYGMDLIRYFLLMLGAVLLPTFVAGYNTRSFCSQGHKYVTGMISLMLWPVWWMFGHLGTAGLFNAYVALLSRCIGSTNADASNFASLYNWDTIDATVSNAAVGAPPAGDLLTLSASVPFLSLGLTALGAFGLFTWVFLVTIGGPLLGHKLVTTGASFSAGAVNVAHAGTSADRPREAQGTVTSGAGSKPQTDVLATTELAVSSSLESRAELAAPVWMRRTTSFSFLTKWTIC